MDIATIIGVIFSGAIVGAAIAMGSGGFGLFFNIPSIFIVIGGTIGATILRFDLKEVARTLVLGCKLAFKNSSEKPSDIIEQITEVSAVVRKEGPLGLERTDIENKFLSRGLMYVADGRDQDFIRSTMELERDQHLERLEEGKRIWKAIGDSAPAFGMIGTLIGLVQMLSTMDDPSSIGPAMAVALLTTLYGALISNVIALPVADKLDAKFKIDFTLMTLAIDGVSQISANRSPDFIRDVLVSYLPAEARQVEEAA